MSQTPLQDNPKLTEQANFTTRLAKNLTGEREEELSYPFKELSYPFGKAEPASPRAVPPLEFKE